MAPSSPPPPPPCWASRCSWRSPWSLQQFLESPSIFSSNVCMRFNLGYCFWNSDNKQRNYTWCHTLLVNSWWCWCLAGGGAGWSHDLQSAKSIPAGVRCHCRASRQPGLLFWVLFKWGQQPSNNMGNGTWTMLLVGRHKKAAKVLWSVVYGVEMRERWDHVVMLGGWRRPKPGPGSTLPGTGAGNVATCR